MLGKCVFNRKWIPKYKWLSEVKCDKNKAYCTWCRKIIELKKISFPHKHVRNAKCYDTQHFFQTAKYRLAPVKHEDFKCTECPTSTSTSSVVSMDAFVAKNNTLKAEIVPLIRP